MVVGPLEPEDYMEPRCLLSMDPMGAEEPIRPIPQQRVIRKLDEYMARRDYAGAERHLLYWLEEARLVGDLRGQLMLRNELAGHYRKTGEERKAIENAEEAITLLGRLDLEGTVSSGTTYVNAGTVMNAFGHNERSLELFDRAREIYEATASTDPALLGGLHNNMAVACCALGRHDEALDHYHKALEAMGHVPGGALEQAITRLNIADLLEARDGMEAAESQIYELLDSAYDLLVSCTEVDDGYRAFVYEKCVPSFSYYGYFAAANHLSEEARRLYERA